MTGNQCDNCRKFEAGDCVSWLELRKKLPKEEAAADSLWGAFSYNRNEVTGNFCSEQCAAEFLYAQVTIQGLDGSRE